MELLISTNIRQTDSNGSKDLVFLSLIVPNSEVTLGYTTNITAVA